MCITCISKNRVRQRFSQLPWLAFTCYHVTITSWINTYSDVVVVIPDMPLLSTLVHIQIHMFHLHDDRNQTDSDSLGNIQAPRCCSYKLLETNSMIQLLMCDYNIASF